MLHSDLFPEFGCDGQLIELPERSTQLLTVTQCAKRWTELSWVADDGRWVTVVYPGMKQSMDRRATKQCLENTVKAGWRSAQCGCKLSPAWGESRNPAKCGPVHLDVGVQRVFERAKAHERGPFREVKNERANHITE